MSRIIKFRAWDEDSKVIIYPHQLLNNKNFFCGFNHVNGQGSLEVSRYLGKGAWKIFPLMQFTGLKDKDDIEIYEMDIVFQKSACYERTGIVVYQDSGFYIKVKRDHHYFYYSLDTIASMPKQSYNQVLGNYFENRNLLEAAE